MSEKVCRSADLHQVCVLSQRCRLALRQLRFEDSECRDAVSNADYWFVGLAAKGMILTPSLPHVATACTDDALVSFAQLRPFLSKEGFAAIARLGLAKVSK